MSHLIRSPLRTCLLSGGMALLSAAMPAGAASHETGGWKVVWSDEFSGTELDRTKWAPEEACWGGGNNERQCYTDREDNIVVEDGVLRLVAQKERFTGPHHPAGKSQRGEWTTQEYTSGKIRTSGLADWTYGRFSARMKLPEGQGTWPALWMMPSDAVYGEWPLSGEIDIMEAVNLETPCEECEGGIETRTSGALHFGGRPPENTYLYLKTEGKSEPLPSKGGNTYTVEWAEGTIQWFVNDELFMRLDHDDWYTDAPEAEGRTYAPFDQPFYLMLNLAVGGNLPETSNGAGFDETSFPAELLVDWVKVEQCAEDPETGRACLTQQEWSGTPMGPWETMAR